MNPVIREVTERAELEQCERVQTQVWGEPYPEVNVPLFRAAIYAGALVAGAFEHGQLLGFAFCFPSFYEGALGQHSHLLAVLPEARGRKLGQKLKWFQRDWCLARGIDRMTWSFDPLRVQNAKLNLEHLGAQVSRYHPDFYGALGGSLNGTLPSDRVIAEWLLSSPEVCARANQLRELAPRPSAARLVSRSGWPELIPLEGAPSAVWLELPTDIAPLEGYEHALAWRLALREAMMPLLGRGYRAVRIADGGYTLVAPERGNASLP